MKINKEVQLKVFAQYFGNEIILDKHDIYTGFTVDSAVMRHIANETIGNPSLYLKPLSSISDEDLNEVANLASSLSPENIIEAIEKKTTYMLLIDKAIRVNQYLQSKGYALPYLEYSVEDLVKSGIYKLITPNRITN